MIITQCAWWIILARPKNLRFALVFDTLIALCRVKNPRLLCGAWHKFQIFHHHERNSAHSGTSAAAIVQEVFYLANNAPRGPSKRSTSGQPLWSKSSDESSLEPKLSLRSALDIARNLGFSQKDEPRILQLSQSNCKRQFLHFFKLNVDHSKSGKIQTQFGLLLLCCSCYYDFVWPGCLALQCFFLLRQLILFYKS